MLCLWTHPTPCKPPHCLLGGKKKKNYKGDLWRAFKFNKWEREKKKRKSNSSHRTEALTLGDWLSVDKRFLINLCHQRWRGPKIELCFIEPRWSLAQLEQLSGSISQSIARPVPGRKPFADCCLYLFQVLCQEIAVWPQPWSPRGPAEGWGSVAAVVKVGGIVLSQSEELRCKVGAYTGGFENPEKNAFNFFFFLFRNRSH